MSPSISKGEAERFPVNPVSRTYVVPPPPRDVLIGHLVHFIICVIVLVLSVFSLFLPIFRVSQYQSPLYGNKTMTSSVTLWHTTTKITGSPAEVQSVSEYCSPVSRRFRVIEAFVAATVAAASVSVVFCVFNVRNRGKGETVYKICCGLALLTFVFATVASSLLFNVYYWSFEVCGEQTSLHSKLYEPSFGLGFFVSAWVLTFVAGLFVQNNPTVPLDARSIDGAIFLFTLFSFIGTLFACVACPITHWFYKNGATATATDVTLWKTIEGKFAWNGAASVPTEIVLVKDYTCNPLKIYFKIAAAMSITSVVFNFAALIWGVLLWQNLTSIVEPAIVVSLLGAFFAIIQFVVETVIFCRGWCDGVYTYRKQKFVLGPGYALCVTSLCVMVLASLCITAGYIGIRRYFPSKLHRQPQKEEVFKTE